VLGENGDLGFLSLENKENFLKFKINDKQQPEFDLQKTELGNIRDLVFDSEFKQLLTIDNNDKTVENVKFWQSEDDKAKSVKTQANSVAFSPNNLFFATAGEDGKVKLWKSNNLNKPYLEFDTHQKSIQSIVFNPKNRNILLSGGKDGTVRLWDISSEQPTSLSVEGQKSIAISSDGNLLATLTTEGKLLMWEKKTDNYNYQSKNISKKGDTELEKGKYNYISFKPNTNQLSTVDKDFKVKLWDSEGKQVASVPVNENKPKQQVDWVDWSKDGKVLIFGMKSFTLWDFQEDKFQEHPVKKPIKFTSIDLSPDGSKLAMTQPKPPGRIKLWDTKSNDNNNNIIDQIKNIIGRINFWDTKLNDNTALSRCVRYISRGERRSPLDYRCTSFVSKLLYLANRGTDTRTIQSYLGHSNIQHTVRYTELASNRFQGLWDV
jgi:WD40 repeat protein